MFTGIIQAVGEIKQIRPIQGHSDNGLSLEISAGEMDLSDVMAGDSIAVSGVCLTVATLTGNLFTVDVSQETLSCTQGLDQVGMHVNLEKAMRLSDRIGGHLDCTRYVTPDIAIGRDRRCAGRGSKQTYVRRVRLPPWLR